MMATITAQTGAILDKAAAEGLAMIFCKRELKEYLAQNKNPTLLKPTNTVTMWVWLAFVHRPWANSGRLWPASGIPKRCLNWPKAINIDAPVIKPIMTGRPNKLAIKPSFNVPIVIINTPDNKAKLMDKVNTSMPLF